MPEIRLYLDEDTINRALIRALRSRNIDVLTSREADLVQVADERHLEHATSLGRTLFTFNARDFCPIAHGIPRIWQTPRRHHHLCTAASGCALASSVEFAKHPV